MKENIAVIMGSSRSDGNTRKIVDYYLKLGVNATVFDLSQYQIGYYDYDLKNADDDFMNLFKKLLEFDTFIMATPIYWYTMSAQMKTFFDRISDMLKGDNKILGRQLRGKSMAVISCGSDAEIFEGFEMPFRESARYLGMHYKGHVHTWLESDRTISKPVQERMVDFLF